MGVQEVTSQGSGSESSNLVIPLDGNLAQFIPHLRIRDNQSNHEFNNEK